MEERWLQDCCCKLKLNSYITITLFIVILCVIIIVTVMLYKMEVIQV